MTRFSLNPSAESHTMMSEGDQADSLLNGDRWCDAVYLNTAAEGLPLQSCAAAVAQYLDDKSQGEPGRVSMWAGHQAARRRAGVLFSLPIEQVALVSSTTEALNTISHAIDWKPGDEVIFTSVEFPSNMFPWVVLKDRGVKARIVQPRRGLVSNTDILEQINSRTRLVSVSQVSYATGQHLDVAPLWERVRETDTLLCIDATQAAGRVSVRGDQADFVIASAFKWLNSIHGAAILAVGRRVLDSGLCGPAGWLSAASCYAPDRLERFHPRSDAQRFEAGMPDFAAVYALAAALDFHTPERVARRHVELEQLVTRTWVGLKDLGLDVLAPEAEQARAGIVPFASENASQIKARLAEQGIHVHGDDGRIRAAVHWYNTPEHIEGYLHALRRLQSD